ncbi:MULTISPECIES: CCC motif membrane protein [Maribacter]|uniref:CCC motif membrane protein n=1 Tax=Maribacter TaxID=252356 RepID=UPI0023EB9A0D|nr:MULTISPECIES: CCC motif membrane protein [Maribacter]MDF4222998.1 CCC motif membrane protein [Maribacter huludaoensis]
MEQQKLPNVTIALILSIVSFFCCCLSAGIGGIIMSGIALILVNKDTKTYQENPQEYSNFSTLKTTKIVAIIGLVLGALSLLWTVYSIVSMGGWDAYMEQTSEIYEQLGIPME